MATSISKKPRRKDPPSIDELLSRAALNIINGQNHFREAAEDIAAAAERGASQRKIAAGVGKSAAWVNALLQWRAGGYQDTPFGPAVKASRERAAVQSTEHTADEPGADEARRASRWQGFLRAAGARTEAGEAARTVTAKAEAALVQSTEQATPDEAATFEQVDVFKAVIADPVQIPTSKEIAADKRKRIAASKVTHEPVDDEAPEEAKPNEAPFHPPSISAIYLVSAFKHVVEYATPEMMSEIIDLVGPENFRLIIAKLQAAYDAKVGADLVKASADHADDEDASQPPVTADTEQDAAAIAAEATKAKRWMH
jgi:hypothetical protein